MSSFLFGKPGFATEPSCGSRKEGRNSTQHLTVVLRNKGRAEQGNWGKWGEGGRCEALFWCSTAVLPRNDSIKLSVLNKVELKSSIADRLN